MNCFSSSENLWGIDLGGTKIEGVILKSAEEPEVLFRNRVKTEGRQGYNHILKQVKKLVTLMEEKARYKPERIGFAAPGTIIPQTGLMKNCNLLVMNGKSVVADLEDLLGTNVKMANDANCFALAETQLGIVKQQFPDAKVVFGIILGTGVGGGLVVNGQVLNGYHGLGGEWGHNYLNQAEGEKCYCGKVGCNESILSGPALEAYYAGLIGQKRKLKDIAQRTTIDAAAATTINRLTAHFGLAVSVLVNIIDPDVIVVGGGVGNIDQIYSEGVAQIHQHVFDHQFAAPVVKPALGDSAGVFGAAYLFAAAHKKVLIPN